MTSDLETTTDDVYNTIRGLLDQRDTVLDTEVAEATGLELEPVRDYLDNADGTQLVVERDGDTRTVQAVR